jgi:tetratricopeptide (TPR) repeat protein
MKRAAVFLCLVLSPLAALPVLVGPALAQVTGPSREAPEAGNAPVPAIESERARRLDELFARLKEAPNARAARLIDRDISMLLARSGSDTADLLMSRATQAFQRDDQDLSLSLLDAVVDLYPDCIEAWSRRATVHFARKELGRAVADTEEVLRREPRHYGAMVGLGLIFEQLGDNKQALAVYRRALEINPFLEKVPDLVRRLEPKVDGTEL